MSQLIRPITARLRRFVGNRREVLRRKARLQFSLSLLEAGTRAGSRGHIPAGTGYTRDISEAGLTLIVPSIHFGDKSIDTLDSTLRIILELPTGPVEIHATPVRCEQLDEKDGEKGYFIGARITRISDKERARYVAHIRRLSMRAEGWGML